MEWLIIAWLWAWGGYASVTAARIGGLNAHWLVVAVLWPLIWPMALLSYGVEAWREE